MDLDGVLTDWDKEFVKLGKDITKGLTGRQFLGNNIAEWIITLYAVFIAIKFTPFAWGLTFIWIENFSFWVIPTLSFQYYHWKAYKNNQTVEEFLKARRLEKISK